MTSDFASLEKTPTLDTSTSESNVSSKEWRTKMAAQQRAKIMAQMASLQTNFMKKNADAFAAEAEESTGTSDNLIEADNVIPDSSQQPICLGPNQTFRFVEQQKYTCILCQEDSIVSVDGPPLVLSAFVQQSTVLFQHRGLDSKLAFKESPYFLSPALGSAAHTSTCGHVMHSSCWNNQMQSISASEARRPYRLRQLSSYDVDKKEFLCPLCECLTNTVIPVVPSLYNIQPNNHVVSDLTFEQFVQCIQQTVSLSLVLHERHTDDKLVEFDELFGEHKEKVLEGLTLQTELIKPPQLQTVTDSLSTDVGCSFQRLFPTFSAIKFSKEIIDALTLFARASTVKSLTSSTRLNEPMMCFRTCTYTILSLEILLRDSRKSLLGDLSSRQRDCIRSLVRLCGVTPSIYHFHGDFSILLLKVLMDDVSGPCILEWDTFSMLVPLTFTISSLFCKYDQCAIACGGTLDHHLLNLLFLSHIVKILITIDMDVSNMDTEDIEHNCTEIVEYARFIKRICKLSTSLNENSLEQNVKHACMPFLRCCAIFYHFLTDIPAPNSLTESLGNYEELCDYLGLESNINKMVSYSYAKDLAKTWCSNKNVAVRLQTDMKDGLVIQPIVVPKLVKLPNDYSELINAVSLFTCPNSERDDSRNPTMCLVCGLMLCSQSYCCQTELEKSPVGACTYHSQVCGAGAGVFLRVRECEVLFLSAHSRGCFVSPPYLDEYGETDQGLRRGNPLTLCADKFQKLQHIWLGHGIHEIISRAIETNTNLATVATQWQHL